ncbi:cobyrinic acid a,c-diamide synthase [Thioalkalivibrio denitrificans]|uniref:Cobyrinic acid a,c-diamide synthase n=1 Tax=Thioalkalivibrio denitrificans TaxID=108003 RepID=A0A1V3NIZ0_9GAMM|nr:ParA family partition ATPase [Thioalkalivibrio denitrificans]OOG24944.1 cobyrinic acid a,c-diamide synthase [Thioalkalivibrio denitrificans]
MSSKVVAVINQKGGTGKTTLTMNLAAGLARRARSLVVDADPQGSAGHWVRMADDRRPFPASVISVAGPLDREVGRIRRDYDYVVVDCPPTMDRASAGAAMSVADVVLIPVLPSPVDLWGSVRMSRGLEDARDENPGLRAFIVVNQLEVRNALSRAMRHALTEIDIPALDSSLRRRAAYRRAALEGCSVYDLGKPGEAAAAEVESIIEEVFES